MKLSQVVKDVKSAKEFIKENKIEPEYYVTIYNKWNDPQEWQSFESMKSYLDKFHGILKEIIIVWEEDTDEKRK